MVMGRRNPALGTFPCMDIAAKYIFCKLHNGFGRNYASTEDIAADVKAKLGGGTVGVVFPILSRNRFAICLRGIAKGAKKVVLMLSYPSDQQSLQYRPLPE